jgi:hypothetical protein
MNIPQCFFPITIDSNGATLTELLVVKSDNELLDITAYSLAYIFVSHIFVASLAIPNV